MEVPSPRSMKHTSERYSPTSNPPAQPLDEAAIEAGKQIVELLSTTKPHPSSFARIITKAYAPLKEMLKGRLGMLACIDCGGLFNVSALLPSSPDPMCDPVCHSCARLTSERAVRAAAKKLLDAFPETMPDEPTKFDIPAYIVQELRDALDVVQQEENQ